MRVKILLAAILAGIGLCFLAFWLAKRPDGSVPQASDAPVKVEQRTGLHRDAISQSEPTSSNLSVATIPSLQEPQALKRLEQLMQQESTLSNKDYFSQADKLFALVCADLTSGALGRGDLRRLVERLAASESPRQRSMGWALAAADGGIENMKLLQEAYRSTKDTVLRTELLMRIAKCTARIDNDLSDWTSLLATEQDASVRRGIMGALARHGSPEVVALAVERITNTDGEERAAWNWSLSQVSNPASFPSLVQLATSTENSALAQTSLNAIAASGQPGSAKTLMDLYASAERADLQETVLVALGKTRDEGNWTTVKDELNFGTDVRRRSAAARALTTGYAQYNPSAVRNILTKLLEDSLPESLRADLERHLQSVNQRPTTRAAASAEPIQSSSDNPKAPNQ